MGSFNRSEPRSIDRIIDGLCPAEALEASIAALDPNEAALMRAEFKDLLQKAVRLELVVDNTVTVKGPDTAEIAV